jgi:uncharacterized protein (DUF2141 family)
MQLSFNKLYLISLLAFLSACAQVGVLSGGDKDIVAPKAKRIVPSSGTIRFNEKKIVFQYDEFVQLKDPQQTIFMVPNDAVIKAYLHKKTLTLSWDTLLQENTTYVLYLNNAVTDVSEGNSALETFVFSTGNSLDTLECAFKIVDVRTNSIVPNITVGLYTSKNHLKPRYVSVTNLSGIAKFAYLKEGVYAVRAFNDENKDLKINSSESRGFLSDSIQLLSSGKDTTTLLLFNPLPIKTIQRFELKAPGIFEVELVSPIKNPQFSLNLRPVDSLHTRRLDDLHYRILPSDSILKTTKLTCASENSFDSSVLRLSLKELSAPLTIKEQRLKTLPLKQAAHFEVNAKIISVDTSKIRLYHSTDSTISIPFEHHYFKDVLTVRPKAAEAISYSLLFLEGAVNGISKPFRTNIEWKAKNELGTLQVIPEDFKEGFIIQLLKDKIIVEQAVLNKPKPIQFEGLIPGDYTLKIIEDRNGNGAWDTGNIEHEIQPETIRFYENPIRIRANWDLTIRVNATIRK